MASKHNSKHMDRAGGTHKLSNDFIFVSLILRDAKLRIEIRLCAWTLSFQYFVFKMRHEGCIAVWSCSKWKRMEECDPLLSCEIWSKGSLEQNQCIFVMISKRSLSYLLGYVDIKYIQDVCQFSADHICSYS